MVTSFVLFRCFFFLFANVRSCAYFVCFYLLCWCVGAGGCVLVLCVCVWGGGWVCVCVVLFWFFVFVFVFVFYIAYRPILLSIGMSQSSAV